MSTYLSAEFGLSLVGSVLGFFPGDGALWLDGHGGWRSASPWHWPRGWAAGRRDGPGHPRGRARRLRGPERNPRRATTISVAQLLIVMAALAALSGGPVRLPRSWLWLPGAFPLALAAGRLLSLRTSRPRPSGLPGAGRAGAAAVVVVCWLVTDARPAFALCLAVLLWAVIVTLPELAYGDFLIDSWSSS